ncbi:hypothetical protein [Methanosphaerula palustris]|uniref:hypothetical protein n=1 Tax=Methanosphaerula palustris TaxID=475088 RepID=UPI0013052F7F|nr:hypothetical protein [Methanosphaerula palustris]
MTTNNTSQNDRHPPIINADERNRPAAPFHSPHGNDRIPALVNGGHAGESCEGLAGLRGVGPAF